MRTRSTPRDAASIAKEVARAAGEALVDEFNGHSGRIGGASDYCDWAEEHGGGVEAGKRVLEVFGRWKGDIAHLYTRMAVELALDASAGVANVRTRDFESIFVGFAQPSRR